MRITYLHQYFNTPQMSGGTRSYEFARRLVSMGHEVNMVTSCREDCGNTGWFETEVAGINVHWYSVAYSNDMSYFHRIKAFLSFAWHSALKAASLDADIIFATSTPLTIALPAIYASRRCKVQMVFEVRDLWPEMPIAMGALNNSLLQRLARMLESWAYNESSVVVTLSPGMRDGVKSTGYPSERIAVIPNSCDNKEFSYNQKIAQVFRASRLWLGNKPLLIYAGTFGTVNGVGYAVSLASALLERGSDLCILLVGEGSEKESIITTAIDAGVYKSNLFIEDSYSKSQIIELFSAASISSSLFVDIPEMRINSANKFFDTLAAGKPVFLNYGGWMHDLILKHRCGISGWGKSIDVVARELDECLHDDDWLEQAGHSSRLLAEKYFDRDILAEQLERVLIAVNEDSPYLAAQIAPGIYN